MKAFFRYDLRSSWNNRVDSPEALGVKFLGTLDALSHIDPVVFANWQLSDFRVMSFCPLQQARREITSLVQRNVVLDDLREPDPDCGYTMVANVGKFKDPRSAAFWARAGGQHESETDLKFADYDVAPDLTIVTYPLFKAALLAINANWQPAWACAYAFRLDYNEAPLARGAPLFPYSVFHIPWLGYLSAPLTDGLHLAAEILTERTPDGGLLMSATHERLDPTNPEHLVRARIIAETMMACTGCPATDPEVFARKRRLEDHLIATMGCYRPNSSLE